MTRICFSLRFANRLSPGLGDMLDCEYGFRQILRAAGSVQIFLITDAKIATKHEELLRRHSVLSGVIVCPEIGELGPSKWLEFYRRLREYHFSRVIIGGYRNPFAGHALLCGIPERVGIPFNRLEARLLSRHVHVKHGPRGHSVSDYMNAYAPAFGVKEPDLENALVPQFLYRKQTLPGMDVPRPIVALHIGGAHYQNRRWPADRFERLCVRICAEFGGSIYLLGGRDEREECDAMRERVRAALPQAPVFNFCDVSLESTANYLATADVFVGNDSGPMRLAAALGIAMVGIFGPTNPYHWYRAYKRFHIATRVVTRGYPCPRPGNAQCPAGCRYTYDPRRPEYPKCLQDITVDRVWREVLAVLNR